MYSRDSIYDRKKIFILLSNTGSIPTRLIKFYTRAPYNHVSIALDEELENLYSFGRRKINNPLIGGFVREDRRTGIYAYFKNTTCVIYELEIDANTYNCLKRVISQFESEKDKYYYSFIGLFGVLLNVPIKRRYRYFCSEFVATVLEMSGVRLFSKDSSLVTPTDFQRANSLKPVYTGKLCHYNSNNSYQLLY